VSISSDSQAALKAPKPVRTPSLLVHQHQKALNDISALHAVELYWVPGHTGVRSNEIADGIPRCGSASKFLGHEPALGVSRQDLRNRINRWLANRHWGAVVNSWYYPKKGSRINLGTLSGHLGKTSEL
jgi:hypothetical protein